MDHRSTLWTLNLLAFLVGAAACQLAEGPSRSPSESAGTIPVPANFAGSYRLARMKGQPLPAVIGQIPERDGSPARCSRVVHSGVLTIPMSQALFELAYPVVSSCSGLVVQDAGARGAVVRIADTVRFMVEVGDGRTESVPVAVSPDTITVEGWDGTMIFVRSP